MLYSASISSSTSFNQPQTRGKVGTQNPKETQIPYCRKCDAWMFQVVLSHSEVASMIKTPEQGVKKRSNTGLDGTGCYTISGSGFLSKEISDDGKSNSLTGRISLPGCLTDSVSSLIRERDERDGSFIFMAIRGASWWIALPGQDDCSIDTITEMLHTESHSHNAVPRQSLQHPYHTDKWTDTERLQPMEELRLRACWVSHDRE